METTRRKREYVALLHTRLDQAAGNVEAAEKELETAMRDLAPLAAEDDGMITKALEGCFDKLRVARQHVTDLRQLLSRA